MANNIERFKIVLLGNCSVGKTSLLVRYVKKKYSNLFSSTIGCSFMAKIIEKNNIKYGLDLWDTAGQERYRSLLPMYYRNANIAIICISVSDELNENYKNINFWLQELNKYNDLDNRYVVIVGTKSDLLNNNDNLNFIDNIKNKYKNIPLFITSSKDDINVNKLFDDCITYIINNTQTEINNDNKSKNKEIETPKLNTLYSYQKSWCYII